MNALDQRLLAAHAGGDPKTLARLYREAGEATQDTARAFYLTHAMVYALEAGLPDAICIEADLRAMGRA